MRRELLKLSKFMSLALRHLPQKAGVDLDGEGWAPLDKFVEGCKGAGFPEDTEKLIREVAETNYTCKFEIADRSGHIVIRAMTGHTALQKKSESAVGLELPAVKDKAMPSRLYFSAHKSKLEEIGRIGIMLDGQCLTRVPLSTKPLDPDADHVQLTVDAGDMSFGGYKFDPTDDGDFWLTDHVPESFIEKHR